MFIYLNRTIFNLCTYKLKIKSITNNKKKEGKLAFFFLLKLPNLIRISTITDTDFTGVLNFTAWAR